MSECEDEEFKTTEGDSTATLYLQEREGEVGPENGHSGGTIPP